MRQPTVEANHLNLGESGLEAAQPPHGTLSVEVLGPTETRRRRIWWGLIRISRPVGIGDPPRLAEPVRHPPAMGVPFHGAFGGGTYPYVSGGVQGCVGGGDCVHYARKTPPTPLCSGGIDCPPRLALWTDRPPPGTCTPRRWRKGDPLPTLFTESGARATNRSARTGGRRRPPASRMRSPRDLEVGEAQDPRLASLGD